MGCTEPGWALILSTLVVLLTVKLGASDGHPAKPRGRAEASHQFIHGENSAYSHLRYDVHFADNVFVLSKEPSVLAADCNNPGQLVLTMSSVQPLSEWDAGTLLVGDKSHGCMKDGKAKPFYQTLTAASPEHISQSPDGNYVVVLHTKEAPLMSCFRHADIYFRSIPLAHDEHPFKGNSTEQRRKLLFSGTYSPSYNPTLDIISINSDGDGASDSLLSILDQDGTTVGCRDCFARLTLGFTFSMKISYGLFYVNLDSFEVSVDGELQWGAGFEAHAPRKVDVEGEKIELWNQFLSSIVIFIGNVPINIDFYGRLEGKGSLKTSGAGDVAAGMQYSRGIKWGVEYRRESLREIKEMSSEFSWPPATIEIPDYAQMDFELRPVVVAELLGIAPFLFGPTATLRFELGDDVRPSCTNLGYQLSYRMKLGFGVDPISIGIDEACVTTFGPCIGGGTWDFDLGGLLPWWRAFPLIPMTPISGAQGCLSSAAELGSSQDSPESLSSGPTGEWVVGEWSFCSAYCGVGVVKRPVSCVNANDNREELEESACEEEAKPSGEEPCHEFSCDSICRASEADDLDACVVDTTPCIFYLSHSFFGLSTYQCPENNNPRLKTRCTWELLYNDKCDSECNTDKCNQDNGKCKEQDQAIIACQEQGSGSCNDCLAVDQACGWCSSSSSCLPGTLTGPRRSDACNAEDWKAETCEEPEPPVEFSSPGKSHQVEAGTTMEIDWNGGRKDGYVSLQLGSPNSNSNSVLGAGFGLPTDDIATSSAPYTWSVPSSLEPGTYILLLSETDQSSSAASNPFEVTAPSVPSNTYTWLAGTWGSCSRTCGPDGQQSRNVRCMENVGSSSESEVADSECSETKPSTSRACNTNVVCQEIELSLETPDSSISATAGSGLSIKWQGGKKYGQVQAEVRKVVAGLSSTTRLNETESPWLQEEFGLPSSMDNTGNYAWSLPSTMSSGRYLMRIISSSDASNIDTTDDPFVVKANVQYSLLVVPAQPASSASIGSLTSMNVTLYGTFGSASVSLAMADSTDEGDGNVAWLFDAASVGSLVRISYEPIGGMLDGAGAMAVHDGNQLNQVGTFSMLQEGSSEVRPVCGQFSSSCAECTRVPGCGYCKATSKCMAMNPSPEAQQRPVLGWCPSSDWLSDVQSCGDACKLMNTCNDCNGVLGCGWCAESCECLSTAIGVGTSIDYGDGVIQVPASCPASSWVDLPQGQTCGALKGDSCSSERLLAQARSELSFSEDGQPRLRVSAQGSTPCRTCASLDCGDHGRCRAEGPNVRCRCRDGYSGEFCQNPPEPCYGKTCSGTGVCFLTSDTEEEKCACLPGFPGSSCMSSSSSRRMLQSSPSGNASCSDPIIVDTSSSLNLNPCDYGDSTGRSEPDAVMLLGPLDATREVTIEASGIDTVLSIFTECPEDSSGPSQIAYNDDSSAGFGSKILFTADVGVSYYVVLEPHSVFTCGDASIVIEALARPPASPPPSPSPPAVRASCAEPIAVDESTSLTLNPCDTEDSTGRSNPDAVMLLGPLDTTKDITIEASGTDTVLTVFTECPKDSGGPSQVAYDDDGGTGYGSKLTLSAESGTQYYVVLETYDTYSCGSATVVFSGATTQAAPPPSPSIAIDASCSNPIAVDTTTSLTLNPCGFGDSTARDQPDAVMLLGPLDATRGITVEASGIDTVLSIFTECPESSGGQSQVAYNDDGGVGYGSKILFTVDAGVEYYVVLEPYDASSCGSASVVLSESIARSPPPPPSSPSLSLGEASCSDPIPVDTTTSLTLNPCESEDSTARYLPDAVMLLGPLDATREITVEASEIDTVLSIFTACPEGSGGQSQVAYNDDGGDGYGSKIVFTAQSGVSYYIVLEPYDTSSCGSASVVLGEFLSLPPAPLSPLSPASPPPPQGYSRPTWDIVVTPEGVGFFFVGDHLSNSEAQSYCEDKYGGELLKVANEQELSSCCPSTGRAISTRRMLGRLLEVTKHLDQGYLSTCGKSSTTMPESSASSTRETVRTEILWQANKWGFFCLTAVTMHARSYAKPNTTHQQLTSLHQLS